MKSISQPPKGKRAARQAPLNLCPCKRGRAPGFFRVRGNLFSRGWK